jgi:streptogramin lyase
VQAKFNIMRKAETNCNDARRFLFLPSPRSDLLHSQPPSVYKDGTLWFSAGSGYLGRLDPKTGKFTSWELPGAKFAGTGKETGRTEYPYFSWVDQFDTLGLGKNTVIVTGTTTDSMLIFDPKKETFSVFRMPYPMSFYTRGLDGRIDDAKARLEGPRPLDDL